MARAVYTKWREYILRALKWEGQMGDNYRYWIKNYKNTRKFRLCSTSYCTVLFWMTRRKLKHPVIYDINIFFLWYTLFWALTKHKCVHLGFPWAIIILVWYQDPEALNLQDCRGRAQISDAYDLVQLGFHAKEKQDCPTTAVGGTHGANRLTFEDIS